MNKKQHNKRRQTTRPQKHSNIKDKHTPTKAKLKNRKTSGNGRVWNTLVAGDVEKKKTKKPHEYKTKRDEAL